jgi:hypothetical protein
MTQSNQRSGELKIDFLGDGLRTELRLLTATPVAIDQSGGQDDAADSSAGE